jgi:DNA repair exonuclease SbcCD ATPase subunit
MGRSSLKKKTVLIKGILKKEGAPPKAKRNIAFKDGLLAEVPKKYSTPKALSTAANDLEQENFRQVWREVSQKKLHYAACILQQFARKFMLCWIMTNDRRTELYEELDYIGERLQGDLQRLEWEKEDMQQDAELEVQAERENGNALPEDRSHIAAHLQEIKSMQAELRSLRQDNERLKRESKELKKENKQLGYDWKEKSPAVEMGKHKITMLERNLRQCKANHDQYLPNIKKWQDSIDIVTEQQYKCQSQGILYRNACLNILHAVRQRYPKKRVLHPIKEIMEEEFSKYHAIPASDVSTTAPSYFVPSPKYTRCSHQKEGH